MPVQHVMRVLFAMLFLAACAQKEAPKAAKKPAQNDSNVTATTTTTQNSGTASTNGDDGEDANQRVESADDDDDDDDGEEAATTEDDDAEDDDDVSEDVSSGDLVALHVAVDVRRDGGTQLKVKGANGEWSTLALPDDDETADIAAVCVKGKTTKLEIAFVHPETGEVKVGSAHVSVKNSGSASVVVAFDDAAAGDPDDNVMTLTCDGGGTLEVK